MLNNVSSVILRDELLFLFVQLKHLPESVVVETPEYKCLQSHFSVLYNDSMQMRTQLEEYQTQIQTLQSSYLRKMELMEVLKILFHCCLYVPVLDLMRMFFNMNRQKN